MRFQLRVMIELGPDAPLVAVDDELEAMVAAARAVGAGDHRSRTAVASHGVDGDARAPCHVGRRSQASVGTISRPL